MKPSQYKTQGNAEPSQAVMLGRCRDQRQDLIEWIRPVMPPRAPHFLDSQEEDMIRHSEEIRRALDKEPKQKQMIEAQQDFQAYHGIQAEVELVTFMANEILREIAGLPVGVS